MRGFQEVTALGHVGKDPEVKYLANGDAVVGFSVACGETWKDKNGNKQERTEWIRCSAFGKLAEIIGEYVRKGDPLFFKGRLRTDEWEDKDGAKKSMVKVIVDEIRLLGGGERKESQQAPPSSQQPSRPAQSARQAPKDEPPPDDFDSEIPF